VDEMVPNESKRPPFQMWKHEHTFNEIEDCKTQVIDRIEFGLPYGFIGKILEFYIGFKLRKIFNYRKTATIKFVD
jgi:ligand-binding SRPBCC domain-containing protein